MHGGGSILSVHREWAALCSFYFSPKPVSTTCYPLPVCWHDGFSSEWTGLPIASGLEQAHSVEAGGEGRERGSLPLYKYPCHAYIKWALCTKGLALAPRVFFTHVCKGPVGLQRSTLRSIAHSYEWVCVLTFIMMGVADKSIIRINYPGGLWDEAVNSRHSTAATFILLHMLVWMPGEWLI